MTVALASQSQACVCSCKIILSQPSSISSGFRNAARLRSKRGRCSIISAWVLWGAHFGCATLRGVSSESISVFAHSPRLLAVAMRSNLVSADVVVTHAPWEESPDAPQHWQMLRRLIAGRARQDVPGRTCHCSRVSTPTAPLGCATSSAVDRPSDGQWHRGCMTHSYRLAWLPRTLSCDPWGPSLAHRFCCCAGVLASLASRRPALSLPSIFVLRDSTTLPWLLRLRFSVLTGEAAGPCLGRQKICDPTLLNDPVRVEACRSWSSRRNWTLIPIISS